MNSRALTLFTVHYPCMTLYNTRDRNGILKCFLSFETVQCPPAVREEGREEGGVNVHLPARHSALDVSSPTHSIPSIDHTETQAGNTLQHSLGVYTHLADDLPKPILVSTPGGVPSAL